MPAGQTLEWFSAATGGTALGTGATFTTPSISTTTTYYAEAKLTAGGCVSTSRTAVVANINALPAAPTAPVDGSRCGPGTVNLSATVPAGQTIEWFSAATGGTALGTGATFTTPSISTTTTYYAEAKVTAGGCLSASRTAVVANITALPAAPTAPVDGSRCGPGTVNLSATVPAGQTVEWFSAATGGTALGTGATFTTPSISTTTTYYAEAKVTAGGCVSTSRTAVVANINAAPAAPTAPIDGSRCGPGTVNLSATVPAGQTIEWFSAATGGTALGTGATFTTPGISATTTYYAEAKLTAGGCVSASRTAVVANINAAPAAPTAPVDGSRCGPGTVNLSATTPAGQTIEWFSAATGGTALGTGATFTTPSISATTTYYAEAKVTAGGCVSASRTAVVANVNAAPAAPTAPVDGSRCGPGTVNLSATVPAGQTIEWFSAATGGTALGTGATFTTPSISTTTTYYAEAKLTAGGCVSASRTAVVANINAAPAAPTAPVDGSRCGPGTVNLSATVPAGQTIEWFSAATGGTAIGTGATFTTPSISTTTTYYAEAKLTAGGCVSASRTSVVANINAAPAAPTAPVDGSRCGPGTVNLSATVPAGQTIEWFSAATGGTALGTGATFTTPSISATTTYYAQAEVTAGSCVSATRTAVVANINAAPAAPTAPVDGSRCGPGTVNLSAAVPAGQTIEWFSAATGGTALGTGATFTTPSISATTTYYAEAKLTAGGCVSATRTAVVANINAAPAAPTAPVDGSRCGPGTVNLSATVPAGHTIEWFSAATGGTALGTGATFTTPSISTTTTYYAEAKVTAGGCVSASRTAVVANINAAPAAPTAPVNGSRCGPGTVNLSATVPPVRPSNGLVLLPVELPLEPVPHLQHQASLPLQLITRRRRLRQEVVCLQQELLSPQQSQAHLQHRQLR